MWPYNRANDKYFAKLQVQALPRRINGIVLYMSEPPSTFKVCLCLLGHGPLPSCWYPVCKGLVPNWAWPILRGIPFGDIVYVWQGLWPITYILTYIYCSWALFTLSPYMQPVQNITGSYSCWVNLSTRLWSKDPPYWALTLFWTTNQPSE